MADEAMEQMLTSQMKLVQDLHTARLANKIAAIVVDTCRENFEGLAHDRGDEVVPVAVVIEMLDGVLAALAGETTWEKLRSVHPEVTPLACARIQALLDGPRLIAGGY